MKEIKNNDSKNKTGKKMKISKREELKKQIMDECFNVFYSFHDTENLRKYIKYMTIAQLEKELKE